MNKESSSLYNKRKLIRKKMKIKCQKCLRILISLRKRVMELKRQFKILKKFYSILIILPYSIPTFKILSKRKNKKKFQQNNHQKQLKSFLLHLNNKNPCKNNHQYFKNQSNNQQNKMNKIVSPHHPNKNPNNRYPNNKSNKNQLYTNRQ